jgi:hypothetical protein
MSKQLAARRGSLCEEEGGPLTVLPAPVSRSLLVDDDAGLLRSSAVVLRDAGFDVDMCDDPAEALDPIARPAHRREALRRGLRLPA